MSKFAAHLYAADSVGEERGVVSEAQRRRIRQSDRPSGLCRVQGAGIVGMALPAARKIAGHGIRVMISAPASSGSLLENLLKEAQHSPGMQAPSPAALGQPQESPIRCRRPWPIQSRTARALRRERAGNAGSRPGCQNR